MRIRRAPIRALLVIAVIATATLAGGCSAGGGSGATPAATATPPTATSPASTSTPTPTATATATPAATPTPTATPCPTYTLVPGVAGMAPNVTDAGNRWNAWLGCTVFSVGGTGIPVDFAPAEIQDIGWGQYTGAIYLMPPTMPPADDPYNGYAGDYERLTCVIMHALGHVLGYQDGSPTAPKIMRPFDWPTWPPTSCATPDSP